MASCPLVELYQPVTSEIAEELRTIVGEQHIIYDEPERMLDYAHGETPGHYTHMPEVVVKSGRTAQVAEIMRLANRERIPVTPRSAGSGLSDGGVPAFEGILFSLERMNRILEIDLENLVAVVEPGVGTNDINGLGADRTPASQQAGVRPAQYSQSREDFPQRRR